MRGVLLVSIGLCVICNGKANSCEEYVPSSNRPDLVVYYESGNSELSGIEKVKVLRYLRKAPKYKTLVIVGHTDGKGKSLFNDALSCSRAEIVKQMIIAGGLWTSDHIKTAYGGENFLAINVKGDEKMNRRCELFLM